MQTHYDFVQKRTRKDGSTYEIKSVKYMKIETVIRKMIRVMRPHEIAELFPHVKEIYDREPRSSRALHAPSGPQAKKKEELAIVHEEACEEL